ncbi:MAG: [FeFe] hydrogenase H-cluster radical SAM maturase HydE [Elusimicrobium sp.]|jgi:biotin synthase|nr:[FeFe] hydrogenase H-cluster radical SAM maturase HydE [Elusimicrobium sp.]
MYIFEPARRGIISALELRGSAAQALWQRAYAVRKERADKIFLRGLIEFSNVCAKDCYYCGIRKSNVSLHRFTLTKEEILQAAARAHEQRMGSVTLQSGEICSENFTLFVEDIVKTIKQNFDLRIVLSCGEQSYETYRRWKTAGTDRYLLKIESSSPRLYAKMHPQDENHILLNRVRCLEDLKKLGFQTGSGTMIGLPKQTLADIADDLLFFLDADIDMCGMGPYAEHSQTPFYELREETPSPENRLFMSLNAVSALRLLMPDINIAAATSFDALSSRGKELAVSAGANVIMLNLTPRQNRADYSLYERPEETLDKNILSELKKYGETVAYGEGGDSQRFRARNIK